MNIEKLAKILEPWMRVETWYTTHPADTKRFHNALFNVHSELGCQIGYDDFKDAIEYLFEKYHSNNKKIENFISDIEEKSGAAEKITCFVFDTIHDR